MIKKIRLSIVLGILCLAGISVAGMVLDFKEISLAAVVGITSLLPKLVESEEKTANNQADRPYR